MSFVNTATGELRGTTILTIQPGMQTAVATTRVATITGTLSMDPDPFLTFSVHAG